MGVEYGAPYDWNELRERMDKLDYPPNCRFDPGTLQSVGKARERARKLLSVLSGVGIYKNTLLDVGCNRGWFAFTFGCFYFDAEQWFSDIAGIDYRQEYIQLAEDIRKAHGFGKLAFLCTRFEDFNVTEQFDVVHFGQCSHYLFRDGFLRNENPLWFLVKAKKLARKFILVDGAFDGDQSVEYDAKENGWPSIVKRMATIEGYAGQLRPEFRLIKYDRSGDPAPELKRYMAVFERIQ